MGLLLLLFLRLSGQLLIGIGLSLYLIPQLMIGGVILLISIFDAVSLADFMDIAGLNQSVEVYSTGTFWEITAQRITDWSMSNASSAFILYIFMILPMMMIGAGAAKLHWLEQAKKQKKKWFLILLIALPLGLAAKLLPFFTEPSLNIQYIQDTIGGPLLGVFYVAVIVLLITNQTAGKLLKPFASAGRMSMTIYLTQSLIGTLIFYSYGLGLYGQISMATGTWLAVAIFTIQVIIADIWLSKFRFGPVEKMWRYFTYGKK